MRWIFALLFIGVSCCVGATVNALASGLDDIQRGTLMIYGSDDNGFCSGTLIAPDLILSAAHCADNGEGVNVRVQTLDELENVLSEKLVYVKAVRTLTEWDVALFSPKDEKVNFVQAFGDSVAVVDVASGDEARAALHDRVPVTALGYPKAFQLQITDGRVSGTKVLKPSIWEKHPLYKISSPITGGNSGGGLYFATAEGAYKLLGVNVAGFRDVSFMNYAATWDAIQAVTQGFVTAKFREQAQLDKAGDGIDGK